MPSWAERTEMRHKLSAFLPQFIYGAFDGIVTTFAVVAAAAGAGLSTTVIIILGLANLVGDGFSMGASAYLSRRSERGGKTAHRALFEGLATFAAFIVAGAIPLAPYIFASMIGAATGLETLFVISSGVALATFAFVGFGKSDRRTARSIIGSLFEALLLGVVAAGLSYLLGSVLATALGA